MTTTADKIQQLNQDLIEAHRVINAIQRELTKVKASIKPPDPEPLECWSWFCRYNQNHTTYIKLTEEAAMEWTWPQSQPGWHLYHLREVTPQDEQDRKDARRYRKAKDLIRNASDNWSERFRRYPDQWDRMIDERT